MFVFIRNVTSIDTLAEEKANTKKGDKYPGFAPHSFELVRRGPDGVETVIKKGVLSFDIGEDDTILYTNGKYIFALKDGEEKVLHKDNKITNVRF